VRAADEIDAMPSPRIDPALPVIVHETATRLRLRFARGDQALAARAAVDMLAGVGATRASRAARSLVVAYDGRQRTRAAVLALMRGLPARADRAALPARRDESLPIELPLLAAALTPLLPPAARPAAALGLVAGKAWRAWQRGDDVTAAALDSVALVSTALTGHPLTATTSLLMGSLAERRRNALLQRTDRLLTELASAPASSVTVQREGQPRPMAIDDIEAGDCMWLAPGQTVPADGIVIEGSGEVIALPHDHAAPEAAGTGTRLAAGTRILGGTLRLRAERRAAESRVARLRDHVRHLLRTRDAPGALTPDLERLVAVPLTAAGLVLAMTGDTARTAAMLQADPQIGISLAQPVAREAAVYATARSGLLLGGLEPLDRLASATAIAFEDVGVLAAPYWQIERVQPLRADLKAPQVLAWLARLAGHGDASLIGAGLPDSLVVRWREHGALLRDGSTLLHVAGARQIEQTWSLRMPEPDRRGLVRRLGVVAAGELIAVVHLSCALRPGVAEHLAQLRALGVRRIAIFTEDATAQPALALTALGADAVVSRDRAAQERWLAQAIEQGERVALVHTGLRDLLPAGGLSVCPVDAEAGAHGVLLGDPLASLVAARATARLIRTRLRRQTAGAVSLNAALMVAAAMRWLTPIATAMVKHGTSVALLQQASRLAQLRGSAPAAPRSPRARRGERGSALNPAD
jgi:Cu2+-exporting ATPase